MRAHQVSTSNATRRGRIPAPHRSLTTKARRPGLLDDIQALNKVVACSAEWGENVSEAAQERGVEGGGEIPAGVDTGQRGKRGIDS